VLLGNAMGWFGGVFSPEQCSLVGFSTDSVMATAKYFDEGGNSMEIKNNADTPQLNINWVHLFLVVLHSIVFIWSALSADLVTTKEPARALPQALPS